MDKRKLLFAVTLLIVTSALFYYKHYQNLKDIIVVCNHSPFQLTTLIIADKKSSSSPNWLHDKPIYLSPGACTDINGYHPKFKTNYFSYATTDIKPNNQDRVILDYVYGKRDNGESRNLYFEGNILNDDKKSKSSFVSAQSVAYCLNGNEYRFIHDRQINKNNCLELQFTLDRIPKISHLDAHFKILTAWQLPPIDPLKIKSLKEWRYALGRDMRELNSRLYRQLEHRKNYLNQTLAFLPGFSIEDENGPMNQGVNAYNVFPVTVFDDPRQLSEGDKILAVNGNPIFEEGDFYHELISHATNRDLGISKALNLTIETYGGKSKNILDSYFFNPNHSNWKSVSEFETYVTAFGDVFTLGNTAELICLGEGLPGRLNNIASKIASLFEGSIEKVAIPDYTECFYNVSNRLMAARQFYAKEYRIAVLLTIPTSSGPRMFAQKIFRSQMKKIVGKSTAKAIAVAAAYESFETAVFFYNEKSPIASLDDLYADYQAAMPYILGGSVLIGIIK